MKAYQKKIIAVSGICIIFLVLGFLLYPRDTGQPEYIFDKRYDIRLADVNKSRSALPRKSAAEIPRNLGAAPAGASAETTSGFDLKAVFSEGLINAHTTLKYFKHLEHQFRKTTTIEEHFDSIRKYLFDHFPPDEAQTLFDTYQNYLRCEMDLLDDFKKFTSAKSPDEAIEVLRRIQEFRRERLGVELADKLYGADVKAKEYAFRRAAVVTDDSLYGKEKEELIKKLNEDMWGEDAAAVEEHPNPYNRYQEKFEVYGRDLAELASDAARAERIKAFREDFFPPETVRKLEEVDRQIAEENAREARYRDAEEKIRGNSSLSDAKKEEQVRKLQEKTFGPEAESFRRREAIQQGRETIIEQNQNKSGD